VPSHLGAKAGKQRGAEGMPEVQKPILEHPASASEGEIKVYCDFGDSAVIEVIVRCNVPIYHMQHSFSTGSSRSTLRVR